MRATAPVWSNWWMQLVAGLLTVAVVVAPWLWIGYGDSSIFPYAADDALGILVVFALVTMVTGYLARHYGQGRTGFVILLDLGAVLGMLALVIQGVLAFEPRLFHGQISEASIRHLWVLLGVFVVSQVLYFLMSKLSLISAVPLIAVLTFSLSYWLQTVASLISWAQPYVSYLWYAGPLLLGLVLGFLGFLRAANLLIWILALAIQWVMPSVFEGVATVVESGVGSLGKFLSALGTEIANGALQLSGQTSTLVTLATAMLASMIVLIVRKAKRRR